MPAATHVPGTTLPALEPISGWTLQAVAGPVPPEIAGRTVPATVPGSAHTDLLDAGLIPDPYLDTNETDLIWAHRTDWRYTSTFAAAPAADGERVDLVMQGLDTVATVTLNGQVVASTANQHRSYRVDVGRLLADGENTLTVDFGSALEYAEAARETIWRPHTGNLQPFNMIRKMACSFGWDWGPDLQTAGIWKPIGLKRWRTARLAQVRPLVTVVGGPDGTHVGRVTVHVAVERADADAELTLRATVTGAPGTARGAHVTVAPGATDVVVVVDVPDADLWWPRGYGAQPLYDLSVTLEGPGGALGQVERTIGFRTVELDTTPDAVGTPFTLKVNGVPVYARGANWIPDDHFLTRVDRARYARRIEQATGANLNLLRVWGGGIYENEDFYDLCDAAGVMVWQDFLFACAAYPEEEPIRGEVEAEARENVVRLVTHPSLVIWNGANENMWQAGGWEWPDAKVLDWGLGYYTELLPRIVAELDPTRPYSTNSPYSPGFTIEEKAPNDPDHGTHHQWDCWNARDYTHYRDDVPRFCSEFGWQGPATWATLTRAVPAEALHKESAAFLLHQKATDGNVKLDRGLAPHLPIPADFEDWHWATQLNQARAVRYGVEHHRSWWPRNAGSVVWQLNDCWPVTSWAAVDGDERLKPLWYALRDAFADRILTVQPRDGRLVVAAVNDTDDAWTGTLLARRTTLDGEVLAQARLAIDVPPREVGLLALPDDVLAVEDARREVLLVSGVARPGESGAGEIVGLHTWAEDKEMAYQAAPFEASVTRVDGGYTVQVTARSLVRDLALLVDKLDPDAQVDAQVVTVPAGELATFRVRSAMQLDEAALVGPRVLRSVNALVAGGFVAGRGRQ